MKRFVLVLTMLCSVVFANELRTVYSYKNALYKAAKADKTVMVMMSFKGCPVCDYMKDIVFERPRVLEYLNDHFIVMIKDIEKDKYPQRFQTVDSPTFFFIDPKTRKEVIEKEVGGFNPNKFFTILHQVTGEPETNTTAVSTQDQNISDLPCNKTKPCKEKEKVIL